MSSGRVAGGVNGTCRAWTPCALPREPTSCSPRSRVSRACTWSAARCATHCAGRCRASSTWSSRATPSRSRGAPPSAWAATLTVHERFGTATVRTGDFAFDLAGARRETYERPGALPDGRAGRDDRGGPGAPRLHRQRDGGEPGRRAPHDAGRARARTSTHGVLRVLHDRSLRRRPDADAAAGALRGAAGLRGRPATREALIDPALLDTVTGDRAGNELRLLLREPPRGARAARPLRAGPGAARRATSPSTGSPSAPGRGCSPLAASCTGVAPRSARRPPQPPRFREAGPRCDRGRGGRLRAPSRSLGRLATPTCGAFCAASASRPSSCSAARRRRGRAGAGWTSIRHRKLSISGDDLVAAGLTGRAGGRGAGAARWSRCSTAARRTARASCARQSVEAWSARLSRACGWSSAADAGRAARVERRCRRRAAARLLDPRTAASRPARSTR